jgi:hypothetical protein
MFYYKGSVLIMHNFTNADETKEWVASKLNKMQATLSNEGMVPMTTSVAFTSALTLPSVSEHTFA